MAVTKKVIALDSMVFIYFLDASQPELHQAGKQLINKLLDGSFSGITSAISVTETLSDTKLKEDIERIENYTLFFYSTPNLTVYPVTIQIALEAARLRRENKYLRTPDSIQLATALVHQADVFITNDTKLQKLRFPNLKITRLDRHGQATK